MRQLYIFAALAFFAHVQTCFGDMIFTITPTNRIDAATQVTITYSITGAAVSGTQDFAAFFVRANFPASIYPTNSLASTPLGITRAPDNTPFGIGGPFSIITIAPGPNAVRWQANDTAASVPGPNNTVDTSGALVGTFNLVWNRLANIEYDAAIPVDRLVGGYKLAGATLADQFINGQTRVGLGVSTIISVPEPGTMTLVGLFAAFGAGLSWYRRVRSTTACRYR